MRPHRPLRVRDGGQATVELALALPVLLMCLLAMVQAGLVVADQVRTVHAAREAARAVAVDARPGTASVAVRDAGSRDCRTRVRRPAQIGAVLRVEVRCRSRTDVALVGALLGDVELVAGASMRVER